jgi:3-oxoacyl-[acyl-carrier-protein] synthase-3
MTYARIRGVGAYLPKATITNEDLEKMMNTSNDWIMQRVGIRVRHVVGDGPENTTTMSVKAAEQAIKTADIDRQEIDMVIVATVTPQYYFPSTACLVQRYLGLRADIPAFDMSAACAGFIYGMSMADQYIRGGGAKNVLVIGTEALTKMVDWEDRSTAVLFGDGAGAIILGADENPGVLKTILHANGNYSDLISSANPLWNDDQKNYLKMQGSETFKLAVRKLGEVVDEILQATGFKYEDIDWLVPHQANKRIIEAMAKKLHLSMDKVILTIENHGNTSAASIPLALQEGITSGKIKPGQTLLFEAIGAGMAWGAALVKY